MSILHPEAEDSAAGHFRPKPDGKSDPAGEAGWFLQRERERRDLSLKQIAEILDIHESHIEGIEQGDLTRLPSRSEALSMVGLYGQYLGFDPKPLVFHYSNFLPVATRAQRLMQTRAMARPLASAKIIPYSRGLKILASRRALAVGASVLGLALVFAVAHTWVDASQIPQPIAQAENTKPAALEEGSGMAVASEGAESSAQAAITESPLPDDAPQHAAAAAQPAEPTDDLTAFISKQLEADGTQNSKETMAASATNTASLAPPTAAPANGVTSRVVLKAKAPVWFRVEDTHGNVIASKIMALGDTYEVPNRDDLVIISRDGGLLGYTVDGVDHGSLGAPGEILVGRSLSISRLLDTNG